MKKYSIALLALATTLAISPAAKADTFYFQLDSSGVDASGTLVGSEIGSSGVYDITSGTIDLLNATYTSSAGSGTFVAAPNSCCAGGPETDDLLYPSGEPTYGTYVDFDGMDFSVNGELVSIWSGDNNYPGTSYSISVDNGNGIWGGGTMAVSATPEPSTLLLLGTGLFGLAFVAFRKAKSIGASNAFETA